MEPSPQQEKALSLAEKFLDDQGELLNIAGFAGVGKTSLAKMIAQGRNIKFAAYTGKAAYVMRQKGCADAKTIHSLIYRHAGESKSDQLRKIEMELLRLGDDPDEELVGPQWEERSTGLARDRLRLERQRDELLMNERRKPMFTLNNDSELIGSDGLIVDECSMVDQQMGMDLLSFGIPIIVMGDPMQLPPVGGGGFLTDRTPDILLTEVHRQAKESGILRLATDIRINGGFSRIPGYYGKDCVVANKDDIPNFQKVILETDQVLVGKNVTRHVCNTRYRILTHRDGPIPVGGDKIVCLRNNHKIGILNGSLWRVHESQRNPEESSVVDMSISSEEDGGLGLTVSSWEHNFIGTEKELALKRWERRDYEEFDFGYALTVHKSQGSQWDDVVLIDESGAFRDSRTRWLYTGVTRAAKKLHLVNP